MKKMPGVPEAAMSEDAAREFLEGMIWPHGPICPHCKSIEFWKLTPKASSKRPGRKGLYKCKACRRQFTVTVGTIFEGSHIPLNKWLMAIYLMSSSKKGISAHQLHRMLGVTYKAAWFMAHRLRFTMTQEPFSSKLCGTVEVDETYVGGRNENRPLSVRMRQGPKRKTPVVALVQRGGDVRTFPIQSANAKTLKTAITENVDKRARVMTDRWYAYTGVGKGFKGGHHTVNHSSLQYVRPGNIHTNTVESYFSLLKRGIMGTFHHVSNEHLDRYCSEFAFRWNHRESTDVERAIAAIKGVTGKRLVYSAFQAQAGV